MNLETPQSRNQSTQPTVTMPVFNNWNVVAEGWYFVAQSREIGDMQAKGFQVCGQELVLFRGADKKIRALDAYCPHMGTHLGIGKVIGNEIRCFFHHWRFNEKGQCSNVPCQDVIPPRAKLKAYPIVEKYNSIWVHPNSDFKGELSDFLEIGTKRTVVVFGKPYVRNCHQHVTMINGIDPQHLKTVHDLDIQMDLAIHEEKQGRQIDITLRGEIAGPTFKEKFSAWLFGKKYGYSMRYDHANNGFLTLVKDVFLFGNGPQLPSLHMIFAYCPLTQQQTRVQPIYVTPYRKGIIGFFLSRLLIFLTKRAFHALQGEDGKVYENMRFYPMNLLAIDKPVAQYIQYVNKLPVSLWGALDGKN